MRAILFANICYDITDVFQRYNKDRRRDFAIQIVAFTKGITLMDHISKTIELISSMKEKIDSILEKLEPEHVVLYKPGSFQYNRELRRFHSLTRMLIGKIEKFEANCNSKLDLECNEICSKDQKIKILNDQAQKSHMKNDTLANDLNKFEQPSKLITPTTISDKNEKVTKLDDTNKWTSPKIFIFYILKAIEEAGGQASRKDIMREIGNSMHHVFNEFDLAYIGDCNVIRWQRSVESAKVQMKGYLGYLRSESPSGIWIIIPQGLEYLNSMSKFTSDVISVITNEETP
jgi:hypothetical protein